MENGPSCSVFIGPLSPFYTDAEVGQQIHHLKDLMLALPDWNRVEDSLFVVSQRGVDHTDLIIDTRNEERSYALIHLPRPNPADVDLGRLAKGKKPPSCLILQWGRICPPKLETLMACSDLRHRIQHKKIGC